MPCHAMPYLAANAATVRFPTAVRQPTASKTRSGCEMSDLPRSARMRSLVASPTGTATRIAGTEQVYVRTRSAAPPPTASPASALARGAFAARADRRTPAAGLRLLCGR